jgi:hypothetical protein
MVPRSGGGEAEEEGSDSPMRIPESLSAMGTDGFRISSLHGGHST